VDHPRFIELREEEVKAIPLKQPSNYDIESLLIIGDSKVDGDGGEVDGDGGDGDGDRWR
jgi:hypothetical protein